MRSNPDNSQQAIDSGLQHRGRAKPNYADVQLGRDKLFATQGAHSELAHLYTQAGQPGEGASAIFKRKPIVAPTMRRLPGCAAFSVPV
jgi:hypothetical protein